MFGIFAWKNDLNDSKIIKIVANELQTLQRGNILNYGETDL